MLERDVRENSIVFNNNDCPHTDETYANQAEKPETRPLYVCRAIHNGVWVAGMQRNKEKVCTVTMHGVVQSYEKYELLENVDGAARIAWDHWDKYLQPHLGAVYVDKMLIARHMVPKDKKEPRYTHYIGSLNSFENFGTISYANEVNFSRDCVNFIIKSFILNREFKLDSSMKISRGGFARGIHGEKNRHCFNERGN